MRVVFFGSSHFSCLVLGQLLASGHKVVAVVTQPDQPAGRKLELCPTEVCVHVASTGLPVFKPAYLRNNPEFRRSLRELQPDALLVASYGQIIPPRILELTPWPLNVHPSLLPALRGASPMRTALLQGLAATGCCIICMTPRMDDGDILLRHECMIDASWNYSALETQLGQLGGQLAVQAFQQVQQGLVQRETQDHTAATYTRTYTRDDTWIDWTQPAARVCSFIRAWDPDIGALTLLPDGRRLKVWRARQVGLPAGCAQALPGTIVDLTRNSIRVASGRGATGGIEALASLELLELQPENKRRMASAEFLAGNRLEVGAVFRQKPVLSADPVPPV